MSKPNKDREQERLTVYYDGACPLCRREISLYQGLKGAEDVDWVDVSCQDGACCAQDLSREKALKRFHIRDKHGQLASGAAAFAELWMAFPGWRWAGRILALPGIRHVADIAYYLFLFIRPLLQRIAPR